MLLCTVFLRSETHALPAPKVSASGTLSDRNVLGEGAMSSAHGPKKGLEAKIVLLGSQGRCPRCIPRHAKQPHQPPHQPHHITDLHTTHHTKPNHCTTLHHCPSHRHTTSHYNPNHHHHGLVCCKLYASEVLHPEPTPVSLPPSISLKPPSPRRWQNIDYYSIRAGETQCPHRLPRQCGGGKVRVPL